MEDEENCSSCNPHDFYQGRQIRPSHGCLALEDWRRNPFIWLHYVQSNDGSQLADFVLRANDTDCWSIHDVQRYFCGQLHCEEVLFTCQYPNLRLATPLGAHSWKCYAATKRPPAIYLKEFHRYLDIGLKKMATEQCQMDRLIVFDRLINIDLMDYYKRKKFFEALLNILSFQDGLQLVSFENLHASRLEGVRLIQQLACFNAHSLKYLFLWYFVRRDENPLLVNYSYITEAAIKDTKNIQSAPRFVAVATHLLSWQTLTQAIAMSTDEEKSRLIKLLQDLEVPEHKLPERCQVILKDLGKNITQEEDGTSGAENTVTDENPYVPDKQLLKENERKLRELLLEEKRSKKVEVEEIPNTADPVRPWRTNSSKERLLRIDCDLKRHLGRANELIEPLTEGDMQQLVKNCREDVKRSPPVGADRLRETVDEARRTLPNFQYRKVDNTTATDILAEAHEVNGNEEGRGDGAGVH